MDRRNPVLILVISIAGLVLPAVARCEPPNGGAGPKLAAAHVGIRPWVSGSVAEEVRAKLESGFDVAVSRLHEEPECREIFNDLGEDGLKMLETTFFYPAELKLELRLCPKAFAYTVVGGAPTWLCRRFSHLSDERAAAVLLHEALHHAGLGESHRDRTLPTPREIDAMVGRACGL